MDSFGVIVFFLNFQSIVVYYIIVMGFFHSPTTHIWPESHSHDSHRYHHYYNHERSSLLYQQKHLPKKKEKRKKLKQHTNRKKNSGTMRYHLHTLYSLFLHLGRVVYSFIHFLTLGIHNWFESEMNTKKNVWKSVQTSTNANNEYEHYISWNEMSDDPEANTRKNSLTENGF